jgi:two-component system, LuxR family, response regulator FixJ
MPDPGLIKRPRLMIFLAEDDNATRDAISLLLECEALSVRGFASCEALCAAVDPTSADLLILDIQMPGFSGLELLERLQDRPSIPPVILMTGDPTGAVRSRAAVAGAVSFLEKPFRGDELVALVNRALASRGTS